MNIPAPGPRFNFAAHLLQANAGRGAKPAFIDDHGALGYGELDACVRRFATALQAAGVRREERVLLLMAERPTPDAVFKRWLGGGGSDGGGARPTVFYGEPTGYAGMLAHPGLPARADVALRLCSSAGEALPAELGGVPDAQGLTRTKAYVVLKAGQHATDAELKDFVKDRLAPYKYPRLIQFVAELPKTATGKIQRFKLRELEQQRGAGAA